MNRVALSLILFSILLFNCKKDIDLNADYKSIPVIYATLDVAKDTQFIKINKAFLGADNIAYAKINDSSYFKNLNIKVEQIINNQVVKTFNLSEIIKPVNDGLFYNGTQKVYYFIEPNLDYNSKYKISGTGDGQYFEAETEIVDPFNFSQAFYLSLYVGVKLATDINKYNESIFSSNVSKEADRYDFRFDFNYYEIDNNGDTSYHTIPNYIGFEKNTNNISVSKQLNGKLIYDNIGLNPRLNSNINVMKRVIDSADFVIAGTIKGLTKYYEVYNTLNSSTGVIPEYTNVKNGRGYFGSVYTSKLKSRELSEPSIIELCFGQFTKNFGFCASEAKYSTKNFYCN